jgi:flagellar biosynthetic protein FliR
MDPAVLARLGLLMIRPGMLVVGAPAFGGTYAPTLVKVGLTVTLALVVGAVVQVPDLGGPVSLTVVIAREVAIGLSIAFAVRILVGAAELAGYLAGFQIGFTYATVADPQTGARNNILSSVYGLLALVVFFAVNAHHDFLRALVMSYDALPVGVGGVDRSLAALTARMLGSVFTIGAQMAAPVIIVLLVVELALGLMSRAAPSLNLMAQGFPIRLIVGLTALALTLRAVPVVIESGIPRLLELGTRTAAVFR